MCERSDFGDFRRETDAARRRAPRQSELRVGVTPCDPGVLCGVVGSVCVPAQFQPRALIRVPRPSGVVVVVLVGLGCRARRTRLSLQSERLSPVVCNTGSVSALHLGEALGQSAPCSPEKRTHSFSADKEKCITLQRQLDLRHSKSEIFKSHLL